MEETTPKTPKGATKIDEGTLSSAMAAVDKLVRAGWRGEIALDGATIVMGNGDTMPWDAGRVLYQVSVTAEGHGPSEIEDLGRKALAADIGSGEAAGIVSAIVADLNGRRGLGIDGLDSDTQDEIRGKWAEIINAYARLARREWAVKRG